MSDSTTQFIRPGQRRGRVEPPAYPDRPLFVIKADLRYLVAQLALTCRLGREHCDSARDALARFHRELFGETGVVEDLKRKVRERFLGDLWPDIDIPDAWVYWPATAGGPAMRNPLVVFGQSEQGLAALGAVEPPVGRPDDWGRADNDWAAWYASLMWSVEPAAPRGTKVMRTPIDDFVERGEAVSAGRQAGLSAYRRWVLTAYGPEALRRFGTFRFLLAELVPAQLIYDRGEGDGPLTPTGPVAEDGGIPF